MSRMPVIPAAMMITAIIELRHRSTFTERISVLRRYLRIVHPSDMNVPEKKYARNNMN